jgi:hypothetical protein
MRRSARIAQRNQNNRKVLIDTAIMESHEDYNARLLMLIREIMGPLLDRPQRSRSPADRVRRSARLAGKPRVNYAESDSE